MLTNRCNLAGNNYFLTCIYYRMMCVFLFFLFVYKPLTVAFLLFAGEYRVDDVPHDLSRTC